MGLMDAIPTQLRPLLLQKLISLYPPFIGAGVKVEHISSDWHEIVVSMRLRWFNRNYVGTHFGGSLYSMTDPFFMLMLLHLLGEDYIVWDRAGQIEFEAPGKGFVSATLRVTDEEIREIQHQACNGDKVLPTFKTQVVNDKGDVVARVNKTLYVRLKQRVVAVAR